MAPKKGKGWTLEEEPEIRPGWKGVLLAICDMRNLALLIAVFAFGALLFAVLANTKAGEHKRYSEIWGNEWLAHHTEWLENRENQEMKELADNYLKLSNDNTVKSFEWEIKTGVWQISAWGFILSLMFALVRFSLGEGDRWKPAIDFSAAIFFALALAVFFYPFSI
ncbi:hypothetical protein ES703_31677 [subsurface metagenome]